MEKGIELLNEGKVKFLITTGGKGRLFNLTSKSLGELTKDYLINKGVNPNKVLVENKSLNTAQNAKFALEIMKKNNFNSAIVITSAYHIGRAKKIFEEIFPKNFSLKFVSSDFFSGLWTIWDYLWNTGAWVKYVIKKTLNRTWLKSPP